MQIGSRFDLAVRSVVSALVILALSPSAGAQDTGAMVEWPAFGNGPDNTKYSALDQIDRSNFHEFSERQIAALSARGTRPRLVALALP